jgi:small subunit ribosomal protein S13
MARIKGVDLPNNKKVEIGLTYIFGIGLTTSRKILEESKVDFNKRVSELTDEEVNTIREKIDLVAKVEGDLRTEIAMHMKRIMDIGCYRGLRHRRGLPARGQNTKNNAKTRKGNKRSSVGGRKK